VAEPSSLAAAIIVAAGRGTRLGAPDKILLPLAGQPLLTYCIDAAEEAESISDIIVVAGLHTKARIETIVAKSSWSKVRHVALGGERRQDSVEAGLRLVKSDIEVVVVHDGARPFATPEIFNSCVAAAAESGAAIAAVRMVDTLKRVHNGFVAETVPREEIWAAQTPQAFGAALLRSAFHFASEHGIEVTDEAGLFEAQGIPVRIVQSSSHNLKVTRPEDLVVAEAFLHASRQGRTRR